MAEADVSGWGFVLMTILGPLLLGLAIAYGAWQWRKTRAAPLPKTKAMEDAEHRADHATPMRTPPPPD